MSSDSAEEDVETTATTTPTPNALDVLLGALPSDQAASLETQLGYTPIAVTTIATSITSHTTVRPTTRPQHRTTSTIPTTSISFTTSLASASATSIPTQSSIPAPPVSQAKSAGAVAGIATGSVAGVVLILLALLYFFRLRKRRDISQSDSQNSLLGNASAAPAAVPEPGPPKRYPESAWLYASIKPMQAANDSNPQLAANAPWSSRPGTSSEHGRSDVDRPSAEMAELPAISVARQVDSSLLEPSNDNGPRRFSYPIRSTPSPAHEEPPDEVVSPLLPPATRSSVQRYYARMSMEDAPVQYPYRDRTRSPSAGRTPQVYRPSGAS